MNADIERAILHIEDAIREEEEEQNKAARELRGNDNFSHRNRKQGMKTALHILKLWTDKDYFHESEKKAMEEENGNQDAI